MTQVHSGAGVVAKAEAAVQSVASTATTVGSTVSTDVAKVEADVSFIRANWGKLSIGFVIAVAVAALVGHVI